MQVNWTLDMDASASYEWLYGQKFIKEEQEAMEIVNASATLKSGDKAVAVKR